ncbi:hypothetical protein Peur_054895 [Populus x canadensis]
MSCGGVQVCEINQQRFLATFQSTNGSGSACSPFPLAPEIAIDPPLTQISFAKDVPAAEQNNIIFASQNQRKPSGIMGRVSLRSGPWAHIIGGFAATAGICSSVWAGIWAGLWAVSIGLDMTLEQGRCEETDGED